MIEYAEIAGIITSIVSAFVAITDKNLIKRFRAKNATTPETPLVLEQVGQITRWRLGRLIGSGIICKVKSNTFYFNENEYALRRNRRRGRAALIAIIAVFITFVFIILK